MLAVVNSFTAQKSMPMEGERAGNMGKLRNTEYLEAHMNGHLTFD